MQLDSPSTFFTLIYRLERHNIYRDVEASDLRCESLRLWNWSRPVSLKRPRIFCHSLPIYLPFVSRTTESIHSRRTENDNQSTLEFKGLEERSLIFTFQETTDWSTMAVSRWQQITEEPLRDSELLICSFYTLNGA
jgi:hypothetical protein